MTCLCRHRREAGVQLQPIINLWAINGVDFLHHAPAPGKPDTHSQESRSGRAHKIFCPLDSIPTPSSPLRLAIPIKISRPYRLKCRRNYRITAKYFCPHRVSVYTYEKEEVVFCLWFYLIFHVMNEKNCEDPQSLGHCNWVPCRRQFQDITNMKKGVTHSTDNSVLPYSSLVNVNHIRIEVRRLFDTNVSNLYTLRHVIMGTATVLRGRKLKVCKDSYRR
jgi:hypothetical protein